MLRAGEGRAEEPLLRGAVPFRHDPNPPAGKARRGFEALGEARGDVVLNDKTVGDDLDERGVARRPVPKLLDRTNLAVDPGANETEFDRRVGRRDRRGADGCGKGRQHEHARSGEFGPDGVHDPGDRGSDDRPAALPAVRLANTGKKHAQEVVDLGDGADGGAGSGDGEALLDGEGRRESVDAIHVGTGELLQELPGADGKGLDVAALTFGVKRVEGKGAFPRTGDAGDDGEASARDVDADAREVVRAGADDTDDRSVGAGVVHHDSPLGLKRIRRTPGVISPDENTRIVSGVEEGGKGDRGGVGDCPKTSKMFATRDVAAGARYRGNRILDPAAHEQYTWGESPSAPSRNGSKGPTIFKPSRRAPAGDVRKAAGRGIAGVDPPGRACTNH